MTDDMPLDTDEYISTTASDSPLSYSLNQNYPKVISAEEYLPGRFIKGTEDNTIHIETFTFFLREWN